jgi:hypothetical protein
MATRKTLQSKQFLISDETIEKEQRLWEIPSIRIRTRRYTKDFTRQGPNIVYVRLRGSICAKDSGNSGLLCRPTSIKKRPRYYQTNE